MSTITLDQLKDVCLQWLANVAGNGSNLPMAEARIRELFAAHLTRQPEVSEELAKRAEIVRVDTLRKLAAYGSAGVAERYDMAMRAAMTAVWHNRPAQEQAAIEKCRMVIRQGIKDKSFKGAMYSHALTALHMLNDYDAVIDSERPAQEKAEPRGEAKRDVVVWMSYSAATGKPVFDTEPPDEPNVAGWRPLVFGDDEPTRQRMPTERVRVPDGWHDALADAVSYLKKPPTGHDDAMLALDLIERSERLLSAAPEASSHG